MENNSDNKVRELRQKFIEEYNANPDLYDEHDLNRVKESNLWVERFIHFLDQGVDKGLDHMKECFQWRKSYGTNHFDRLTIPIELYQMAPVFIYQPDKDGLLNLYIRVKMHRKIDVLQDRIKQSFVDFVDRIDAKAGKEFGWRLIFDCSGAGYASADLDFLFFIMPTIRKYYPNGCKNVAVVGLPWILNNVAKFALAFMPTDTAKKIRFYDQEQLEKVIGGPNLPDFLGGICSTNYCIIPKGAKTCLQLGKELYGLSEEQVVKMMGPSMKYIKEGAEKSDFE